MASNEDASRTRASAAELKFLVDLETAARIRESVRSRLRPDPHGRGAFGDQYPIATLYFDSPDFEVFHRCGSYGRAKYRVRRYGCSGPVFLERKMSKPGFVAKRRASIASGALARVLRRDPDRQWEGEWFRRRLAARRLGPVCQVSYLRTARVISSDRGPIRLTLDEGVSVLSATGVELSCEAGKPVFEGQMVLEMKYVGPMPDLFAGLIDAHRLDPRPASKYRFAVAALGLRDENQTSAGPSQWRVCSD